MGSTMLQDLTNFIHTPFRSNMDLFSVALAVGLVLVLVILWSRVIAHLGV
jgi:hypothetical protein